MRKNSFEMMRILVVLVMLIPTVASAHVHGGNSNITVDPTPTTVAPGGTIDVSFDYTVTHIPPPSHGVGLECPWEIWLDDQPSDYIRRGVALLASGGNVHDLDPFEQTFAVAEHVEIPLSTPAGPYYIKVVTAAAPWSEWGRPIVYGDPDGMEPITVTQPDTTPPVITCPDNFTVYVGPGETEAVVEFEVTATDDVSAVEDIVIVCDPLSSGDTFPLGDTPVTCTATDEAGNQASCTFTIAVVNAEDFRQDVVEDIIDDIEYMDVPEAEKELGKAVKELNKAIKELNKGKPDKAIKKIEKAIKQLEKAQDKGAETQDVIDALYYLIEVL